MPVVELTGVAFAYRRGVEVVHDVDLAVERGEFVALAGPNGGGKTTLVRLIVGLGQPTRGTVSVFGERPQRLRRRWRIGYLPQRAQSGIDAPTSVAELVASGRVARTGVLGPLRKADHRAIAAAIDRLGLEGFEDVPIETLSGGQQQRAFLAKLVAGEPELIVLDEPTTGVDADAQSGFAHLLHGLQHELEATILYVSHEFGAIEPFVSRLVLVRQGISFDGRPEALPEPWHDPSHGHPRR
jgi:zinc transport system ATP-binding protein